MMKGDAKGWVSSNNSDHGDNGMAVRDDGGSGRISQPAVAEGGSQALPSWSRLFSVDPVERRGQRSSGGRGKEGVGRDYRQTTDVNDP